MSSMGGCMDIFWNSPFKPVLLLASKKEQHINITIPINVAYQALTDVEYALINRARGPYEEIFV